MWLSSKHIRKHPRAPQSFQIRADLKYKDLLTSLSWSGVGKKHNLNKNSNITHKTLHGEARYTCNQSPFICIFIADAVWEEIWSNVFCQHELCHLWLNEPSPCVSASPPVLLLEVPSTSKAWALKLQLWVFTVTDDVPFQVESGYYLVPD